MLYNISRCIARSCSSYARHPVRCLSTASTNRGYVNNQIEFIKSALENKDKDWDAIKKKAVTIPGSLNETNVSGIMLKVMLTERQYDMAESYAKHLKSSEEDLNLGAINGILTLYYKIGTERPLTDDEKQFVLNTYRNLYKQYEVLDAITSEKLVQALCAIGDCKKAMKVFEDIHVTCIPSHAVYDTLIATFFKYDKKDEALRLAERAICNQRPLRHTAYEAWINYVLRKYKHRNMVIKYLDEICEHISKNFCVIPEATAEKLRATFSRLGLNARFTRIRKTDGQCVYCKTTLNSLKLSEEEFKALQENVEDRIIVGSDILLKTNPEELKQFTSFLKKTGPYDIVLDALNVCYATGRMKADKVGPLIFVVEHFKQLNKKILVIGRKHMLKWPKMNFIMRTTSTFVTEDESQDDPYFITAAILSGPHTDFVSKDLLRGHRFQFQDERLRFMFQRWQWEHQWKAFVNKSGSVVIMPPLAITPCAQKKNDIWHLPFEREEHQSTLGQIRDGTPDWGSWLCLQPRPVR